MRVCVCMCVFVCMCMYIYLLRETELVDEEYVLLALASVLALGSILKEDVLSQA